MLLHLLDYYFLLVVNSGRDMKGFEPKRTFPVVNAVKNEIITISTTTTIIYIVADWRK